MRNAKELKTRLEEMSNRLAGDEVIGIKCHDMRTLLVEMERLRLEVNEAKRNAAREKKLADNYLGQRLKSINEVV